MSPQRVAADLLRSNNVRILADTSPTSMAPSTPDERGSYCAGVSGNGCVVVTITIAMAGMWVLWFVMIVFYVRWLVMPYWGLTPCDIWAWASSLPQKAVGSLAAHCYGPFRILRRTSSHGCLARWRIGGLPIALVLLAPNVLAAPVASQASSAAVAPSTSSDAPSWGVAEFALYIASAFIPIGICVIGYLLGYLSDRWYRIVEVLRKWRERVAGAWAKVRQVAVAVSSWLRRWPSLWRTVKHGARGMTHAIADSVRVLVTMIIPRRPEVVVPQPFSYLPSDADGADTEREMRDYEASFGDVSLAPMKTKKFKGLKAHELDDARSYSTVAPSYHTKDSSPSYASKDPHPPPSSSAPTYRSEDGPYLASRPASPPGSVYSEVESLGEVPDVVADRMPMRPPPSVYRPSLRGAPSFTLPRAGHYLTTTQRAQLAAASRLEDSDATSSMAGSAAPLLGGRG